MYTHTGTDTQQTCVCTCVCVYTCVSVWCMYACACPFLETSSCSTAQASLSSGLQSKGAVQPAGVPTGAECKAWCVTGLAVLASVHKTQVRFELLPGSVLKQPRIGIDGRLIFASIVFPKLCSAPGCDSWTRCVRTRFSKSRPKPKYQPITSQPRWSTPGVQAMRTARQEDCWTRSLTA